MLATRRVIRSTRRGPTVTYEAAARVPSPCTILSYHITTCHILSLSSTAAKIIGIFPLSFPIFPFRRSIWATILRDLLPRPRVTTTRYLVSLVSFSKRTGENGTVVPVNAIKLITLLELEYNPNLFSGKKRSNYSFCVIGLEDFSFTIHTYYYTDSHLIIT